MGACGWSVLGGFFNVLARTKTRAGSLCVSS
jgi:hypothetical protein